MACCADSIVISGDFGSIEAFDLQINQTSSAAPVRYFGGPEYGPYLACSKDGTATVQSYVRPSVDIDDTVTLTANVCSSTISVECVVTDINWAGTAGSPVSWSTTIRFNDDPTIG